MITLLKTKSAHKDCSKKAANLAYQFHASDGFVLERLSDGAFRVSHKNAPKALGIGSSDVLEWEEDKGEALEEPEPAPLAKTSTDKRASKVA